MEIEHHNYSSDDFMQVALWDQYGPEKKNRATISIDICFLAVPLTMPILSYIIQFMY